VWNVGIVKCTQVMAGQECHACAVQEQSVCFHRVFPLHVQCSSTSNVPRRRWYANKMLVSGFEIAEAVSQWFFNLGSIEPLGFDGAVSEVRRRSSETWLKVWLYHNKFYFLLYWAKMGFDKSLESYVRVRRVCKS